MAVAPVSAAPVTFQANLSGAQEVIGNPPTCAPPSVCGDPDGSGFAEVVVDTAAGSLCYSLTVAGIDTPVAAHIHEGPPGVAGPVVVTLATPAGGASSGCAVAADYNLANSGDPDVATLLADIAANPGNYYVNVHTGPFPAGAVRGQLGVPFVGSVMIMKHLCDPSIQTEAQFQAVEARAATNPTTPMGVPSLGATTETVLACPVIVQPGDTQTPGAIGSGSRAFDFTVTPTGGATQTLSTGATFTGDNGFTTPVEDFACETHVGYDANRNGTLQADVCLDFSSYGFGGVLEGPVTVVETAAPPNARFGTVRLTPAALSDDAAIGLSFTAGGTITFNSSLDADQMVMLHVYNFQNVAAPTATPAAPAATSTARPAASQLPNSAVHSTEVTWTPVAWMAGLVFLVSLGGLTTVAVVARRRR